MINKKLKYAFFNRDGQLSRQRVQRLSSLELLIVSDDPLTPSQQELFADLYGLSSPLFEKTVSIEFRKLTKFVTKIKFKGALS